MAVVSGVGGDRVERYQVLIEVTLVIATSNSSNLNDFLTTFSATRLKVKVNEEQVTALEYCLHFSTTSKQSSFHLIHRLRNAWLRS